jgi:hypothetical protein
MPKKLLKAFTQGAKIFAKRVTNYFIFQYNKEVVSTSRQLPIQNSF